MILSEERRGDSVAETRKKRSEVQTGDTWDATSVYADDKAWDADFASVEAALPGLAAMSGKLAGSGEALLEVLEARDEIGERLERLSVYSSLVHDVDTADSRGQALSSRVDGLWSRFGAATAFVAPEMLQVPAETMTSWRDTVPGLAPYRRTIDETLRLRDHVRSAEVEEVLAELGEVRGSPSEIAGFLRNADMRFVSIRDENGNKIELSEGLYRKLLQSNNRRVRRQAFAGIMNGYAKYRNTLGASLSRSVKRDVSEARIRRYPSALEAALGPRDIPIEVYRNLVKTCRAQLPVLHRYLEVHRKALKLRELHPYDLFVSIVPNEERQVAYGDGVDMIVESVAPLGTEYQKVARKGLTSDRWVDVYENEGKRSGAYSGGAYKTYPFILMNYAGTLDDVFTLTHELGHSMHSWYTRKHQPYPTGDYTIFVAEVASTFNEELLRDHLLREAEGQPRRQAALLGSALDDFRGTFFRQTLFAEFELEMHERAEKGEALTAETLSDIYKRLNEEYYGAVVTIDKEVWGEWARIPHFYSAFYVFQYATGIAAATALARKVLDEGKPAAERYLDFLKGGSSTDPLALLRGAGVDMTTPEPIERALEVFGQRADRLERLLKQA
jgi:oligoendopeptidase F